MSTRNSTASSCGDPDSVTDQITKNVTVIKDNDGSRPPSVPWPLETKIMTTSDHPQGRLIPSSSLFWCATSNKLIESVRMQQEVSFQSKQPDCKSHCVSEEMKSFFSETLVDFQQRTAEAGPSLNTNKCALINNPLMEENITEKSIGHILRSSIQNAGNFEDKLVHQLQLSESKSKLNISTVEGRLSDLQHLPNVRKESSTLESIESMIDPGYRSYNSSNTSPRADLMTTEETCSDSFFQSGTSTAVDATSYPRRTTSPGLTLHTQAGSMCPSNNNPASGSADKMSKIILDLIGPNSRVGNLILQSAAGQDCNDIFNEIKQCVQAELQATSYESALDHRNDDSLQNLNDSLDFVKEHLTQIKTDFNEFKETCWVSIDSKVSHAEYSDTTTELRSIITDLEQKLFNEQRIMRQDMRGFEEKIKHLQKNECSSCFFNYISVWPVVAFIGAYSLMKFGQR